MVHRDRLRFRARGEFIEGPFSDPSGGALEVIVEGISETAEMLEWAASVAK
jgi:hypothetical protein